MVFSLVRGAGEVEQLNRFIKFVALTPTLSLKGEGAEALVGICYLTINCALYH
jgi:hypothetical protein